MQLSNLFFIVLDLDQARAFYSILLGQEAVLHKGALHYEVSGVHLHFYTGAEDYGLSPGPCKSQGISLHDPLWPARLTQLEAAGCRPIRPWGPAPWGGELAIVADPFGFLWELYAPAKSCDKP